MAELLFLKPLPGALPGQIKGGFLKIITRHLSLICHKTELQIGGEGGREGGGGGGERGDRGKFKDIFSYFSKKTHVVTPH